MPASTVAHSAAARWVADLMDATAGHSLAALMVVPPTSTLPAAQPAAAPDSDAPYSSHRCSCAAHAPDATGARAESGLWSEPLALWLAAESWSLEPQARHSTSPAPAPSDLRLSLADGD